MRTIVVGTRASKLALTQTNLVVKHLKQHHPGLDVRIHTIQTTGDRVQDVPLARIGGDGLFVSELERALSDGRVDLAVHSLKDVPTLQPDDLQIVVMGPREDVRDIILSRAPLEGLHELAGLRIGTSSLRRTAQLAHLAPTATMLPIRGNVDTRVRKLISGDYDAIVLAAAGFHRLQLQGQFPVHLTYLPLEMNLPAPGQGALGLECRRDDHELLRLLAPLRDLPLEAATRAERHFMRHLGAGCYLPVAAFAELREGRLCMRALVISLDGKDRVEVSGSVHWQPIAGAEQAEYLGVSLAMKALTRGADRLLEGVSRDQKIGVQHV